MYVGVKGKRIAYVGDKAPAEDYDKHYDGRGKLLIPGFINAHSHTPMTLLRGYGENLCLSDWLQTRIFPFEAKLTGKDIYYSTLCGCAEMIRFGIVSATDMYSNGEELVSAFSESGMKANISVAATCFDDRDYYELPNYKETEKLFKSYNGFDDGRIIIEASLHAEYTSTPKVARGIAEFAKTLGAGMHIHMSETLKEHEECKARHGKTPANYFESLGLFDVRCTAAHCVFVEDEDILIMKEKGVNAATCPKSNLKLASGVLRAPELLKNGINVAIGTDSVASNNNLNMIEEIKFYALLYKGICNDPTVITPKEAVIAAARSGAIAQGREDTGLVKEGLRADLVVLDTDKPYMKPAHDLLSNIVYSACGTDVVLTMADGKILFKDGEFKTIDIEKASYELDLSVKRILSTL